MNPRSPGGGARWNGRRAARGALSERVDCAVGEVVATLDYGTPVDETHLQPLRDAIEGLETVVEYDLIDLVEEAIPFERTAGWVPVGRLYDALAIDREQAAEQASDE